ncbi:hypothetical protein QTP88_013071 [Uroleucon formosanum]
MSKEPSTTKEKRKNLRKDDGSKILKVLTLYEYLIKLPEAVQDRLYSHPPTCLTVFRVLPDIAQQFTLRILFIEQPVPQSVLSSWVPANYSRELDESIEVATNLHIWKLTSVSGGLKGWILNSTFKKKLKVALMGGGRSTVPNSDMTADPKARDIDFLDSYAYERWECILHYMVGSKHEGISSDAVRVLLNAGLMVRDTDDSPVITSTGFQFLLLDMATQVWYFMLRYMETVESRGLDLAQCLTFLFQIHLGTLGWDYITDDMSENLQVFLQHLREFGLVYQRKRKAGRFYPTRLVIEMGQGNSRTSERMKNKERYIVVETNFRIYAMTDSDLKVALVALFTHMLYRFPNMSAGILTRDSVRTALRSGITAAQIVRFLTVHTHPQMQECGMPQTVIDQIYLWENERNRLTYTDGVLYSNINTPNDYETIKNYAADIGALVWCDERRRNIVVSTDGHDDVRKFWKKQPKSDPF